MKRLLANLCAALSRACLRLSISLDTLSLYLRT